MKISIVSGSMRNERITQRVALHLLNRLKDMNVTVQLIDVRELNLDFVTEAFAGKESVPAVHAAWAQHIFDADAFIMVTPEYNGSYTPALKNVFDHFPKQAKKVFGIVTASPGSMGGMRAAMQLQQLVPALFGILSPQMLITPFVDKKFDALGNLIDTAFQKSIDTFLHEFLWLAMQLKK